MEDFASEEVHQEVQCTEKVLSSREKYKLILPVLLNIASITSSHGTDQFKSYLHNMRKIEDMVREGKDINCVFEHAASHITEESGAAEGSSIAPPPLPPTHATEEENLEEETIVAEGSLTAPSPPLGGAVQLRVSSKTCSSKRK